MARYRATQQAHCTHASEVYLCIHFTIAAMLFCSRFATNLLFTSWLIVMPIKWSMQWKCSAGKTKIFFSSSSVSFSSNVSKMPQSSLISVQSLQLSKWKSDLIMTTRFFTESPAIQMFFWPLLIDHFVLQGGFEKLFQRLPLIKQVITTRLWVAFCRIHSQRVTSKRRGLNLWAPLECQHSGMDLFCIRVNVKALVTGSIT